MSDIIYIHSELPIKGLEVQDQPVVFGAKFFSKQQWLRMQ